MNLPVLDTTHDDDRWEHAVWSFGPAFGGYERIRDMGIADVSSAQPPSTIASVTIIMSKTFTSTSTEYESFLWMPESSAPAAWLYEALDELAEVDEEAAEDGLDSPAATAKLTAEHVLRWLADNRVLPSPSVYPTRYGAVAIRFERVPDVSIIIICSRDGRAACYLTVGDDKKRRHFEDALEVPDNLTEWLINLSP